MIRYYICPVVYGVINPARPATVHAEILNIISLEPGSSTAVPDATLARGWTFCFVNRNDHSEIDAAPDIDDVLQGVLGVALTKSAALQKLNLPLPANKRAAIETVLSNKGIDNTGLTTARDVLDRVLKTIDPKAMLENLGSG